MDKSGIFIDLRRVGLVSALDTEFSIYSFRGYLEDDSESAADLVFLLVGDKLVHPECDFHEERAVIRDLEIDTGSIRNEHHLIEAVVLELVVCFALETAKALIIGSGY